MSTFKLYYDLSLAGEFDSYAINVFELSSTQDTGILIETVVINPLVNFIEINNAVSRFSWFKLQIVNQDASAELDTEDLVLAEEAFGRVVKIREAIKDTKRVDPAFSDQELLEKMRLAAMRLNNIHNLDTVHDRFWPVIELLVRIDICSVLAFDYAKYMRLEIPGGPVLMRDELYTHYIRLMKSLEEYFKALKTGIGGEMGEAGDGETVSGVGVSTMSRISLETGAEEKGLEAYIRFPEYFNQSIEISRKFYHGIN